MRKIFNMLWLIGFFWAFLTAHSFAGEPSTLSSKVTLDNESVSQKLDKIIAAQAEILKQLDEVKAELEITKIRASQR
ncbi:MAG: hypothetical protein AUJ71_03260 [Candidatus Omnitrophica bacterium CG1_02_49_16]|nr:MAG: hypothetical protein AUJ71_03260 [Candidatus Omnitrophica bacterium CG1_02_49_16]